MGSLPVRGAPRRRTNRERSWRKTAPPPRRRGRTKGRPCSLQAWSCPFSILVSHRAPESCRRPFRPLEKGPQHELQLGRISRCFKGIVFNGDRVPFAQRRMLKPITLFQPFGERRECAAFEIRPNKIDLDEPSGVVERIDLDAKTMFPPTVALPRVPPLNTCECRFHGAHNGTPFSGRARDERPFE